jgi:hypothetical protein
LLSRITRPRLVETHPALPWRNESFRSDLGLPHGIVDASTISEESLVQRKKGNKKKHAWICLDIMINLIPTISNTPN